MFKIAEIDHCSSNPSSDPGSDPSSDPSSDPGSDPSSNPGSKFRYPPITPSNMLCFLNSPVKHETLVMYWYIC